MRGLPRYFGLLVLTLAMTSCERDKAEPPPVPSVKAIPAEVSVAERIRAFSGRVVPADTVEIAFAIGGRVIALRVNEGDDLTEGQVVAELDPSNYRLAVESTRAKVEAERAALREADDDLGRKRTLFQKQVVAKAAIDKAQAAYEAALGRLRIAESEYALRQSDLEKTSLTSPIAGRVIERPIKQFAEVTAGQPILSIGTQESLEVSFLVPEALIDRVSLGQDVMVDLPAIGLNAIPARITEIAGASSGGNAFPVRAALLKPNTGVRLGITAAVSVPIDAVPRAAFMVPISAFSLADVGEPGDKAPIFVLDPIENRVRLRHVEVGDARGSDVEVLSGIEPGELIVVSGVPFLRDGMPAVLWKPLE